MRKCEVKGCEKKHEAKGFCKLHYSRQPSQKQKMEEYQKRNKEKIKKRRKESYQRPEVKARIMECDKKWRKNNREKYNKICRKWRNKNPEKVKEYCKTSKKRRKQKAIENMKPIMENMGFSKKTQEAFVLDGVLLDKRMDELKKKP